LGEQSVICWWKHVAGMSHLFWKHVKVGNISAEIHKEANHLLEVSLKVPYFLVYRMHNGLTKKN
jgi:hypothetical protein